MLKICFILLTLTIMGGSCYATDVSCIDSKLAEIKGLAPGKKPNSMLLNKALSVQSFSGEDDGGGYLSKRYTFKDYEVTIVRGVIDSIRVTSSNVQWVGMIRLSSKRKEAERLLAPYRVYSGDKSSQYLVCSNYGDVYATLGYEKGFLQRLEISIDRP